jgi:hypothetical protein
VDGRPWEWRAAEGRTALALKGFRDTKYVSSAFALLANKRILIVCNLEMSSQSTHPASLQCI